MKRLLPLLLWLACAPWLTAQPIRIEVATEQDQFLSGEPIVVTLRVSNLSGRSIQLGTEDDWLDFNINDREGRPVSRLATVSASGTVNVLNAETVARKINLTPFFDFPKTGIYRIVANVKVRGEEDLRSNRTPKTIEIIRGAKVWEQDFGAPISNIPGTPTEARKYILLRSPEPKKRQLYLRLTTADEGQPLKVMSLGPTFTFNQPEAQVDRNSLLHVFHQTGQRFFTHTVISPDGDLVLRGLYENDGSRPALRGNSEGLVAVAGGTRRPSINDYPPAEASETQIPIQPIQPVSPPKPTKP